MFWTLAVGAICVSLLLGAGEDALAALQEVIKVIGLPITAMMFVQALEKAHLLGLPKAYRSIRHHEHVVRGRIDIPRFIREDLPFAGRVASVAREQLPSQSIIDVLAKAIQVIDRSGGAGMLLRIAHVRMKLVSLRRNKAVDAATIRPVSYTHLTLPTICSV